MAETDRDILELFDENYNTAWQAWDPFFPEAEMDMRFFLGDQWDESEKRSLHDEGRSTFVFNRIRRVVNLVTGYQRKNRLSSVVAPLEDSDQKTADQLSQLLMYVMNADDGYQVISDCFGGALKTGWNLAGLHLDYRDDPINGDIRFTREPWNGFIVDPYFTKMDFSDCSYILRRKYLPVDLVASLLPNEEKEIYEIAALGWERDDKFTWLPYQRQGSGKDYMSYSEMWRLRWKKQPVIVDMETGQYADWEGDDEDFVRLKLIQPTYELISRQRQYVQLDVIVNDQVIRKEIDPYGLNEYPFVPFVGIFEPESDQWGLKVQSLIRCMRDPQRETNRRRSQMVDILDSQINSGWIATEGAVVNPRSLFQNSQGKVVWRNADAAPGAIEKIAPAQIPPSMFQLQQQFDADITEIAGVNDAAFGQIESANESGVMQMLRQGAAITNLQDVFDNLRQSQQALSRKALKLIQTWSPSKVQRIINELPTQEFYNQQFTKYDCVVQEGVLTDTQRQMFFRQLIDLQAAGVPVPPALLAKAAPLQGKSEYNEAIEQMQQQQAQAAQQQQQVQSDLIAAQTDLAKSRSLEQVAGAKERFTRSVANLGLEDERNAQAVENRADASMKRVQTAAEIEKLGLFNASTYLDIVERLDRLEKGRSDELKQEDVEISAVAEQVQQPLPSEQQPDGVMK